MSKNFNYPVENACPHDGWYNGNPKLMIQNGTYLDYRHKLEEFVAQKKMQQSELDALDKAWAAVPLEMKKERRGKVLESIKKVAVRQKDGKINYVSKPSDNGSGSLDEKKPLLRRQLTHRQPLGSIDTRPDPFTGELPSSVRSSDGGIGNAVPEGLPGMGLAMAMA